MRCNFFLIRHGETTWNVQRKMQGQVNIPLNENGRIQARKAAQILKEIPFDICCTSPLSRARETAEIVMGGRNVPIVDVPLLLEQSYGLSEGALQDIGYYDPKSPIYGYQDKPEIYQPDIGAESFEDLMCRGEAVINDIMLPMGEKYENVLIASHGAMICSVLNTILKIPIKKFWQTKLDNCGIARVMVDNGRVTDVDTSVLSEDIQH